jgi:hypothetical protein
MTTKKYIITNVDNKMVQEEIYTNILSTNKKVNINVISVFGTGAFVIDLTDEDKDNIMNEKEVKINDYDYEFIEMSDCCSLDMNIVDKKSFSKKEIKEIEKITEELDEDYLDDKGWAHDDTNYIMFGEVDLELENPEILIDPFEEIKNMKLNKTKLRNLKKEKLYELSSKLNLNFEKNNTKKEMIEKLLPYI